MPVSFSLAPQSSQSARQQQLKRTFLLDRHLKNTTASSPTPLVPVQLWRIDRFAFSITLGISQADCVTIFEEEVSTPQFNFHFERLPRSVQVALEAPQALPPGERRDLVRCIAHDMMQVSPRPRREFIRSVAEAVVKRFPACLQDRTVNGKVFGRGYDSLFQQLENRVENLGRVKQQGLPSCVKTKKCSYGCANWQPVCLQPVETVAEKIQFLKGEAQKTLRDIDVPLAQTCMDATYSEQRRFINSDAPVHSTAEVREEWPLLFHKSFFYKHACQLLGKNMRVRAPSNGKYLCLRITSVCYIH